MFGDKQLDFNSFKSAAQIILVKGHLTEKGLKEIQGIKQGMNKGRY
jgi:hypothetical protein